MAILVSKTGYIQSYKVELSIQPMSYPDYFYIEITDDQPGTQNLQTWVLNRNISDSADQLSPGLNCAVSYSNASQALIATVKDAFNNENKVILEGYAYVVNMFPVPGKFWLHTITILK